MIYPILLGAGLVGLVAMALLGFLHVPGHGGHGHGHGGHSLDAQTDAGHTGALHGHGHTHAGHGHGAHPGGGHSHASGHGHAHGHGSGNGHGHGHGHGQGEHGEHGEAVTRQGRPDPTLIARAPDGGATVLMRLLPFISPLNWCSWAIGAGATGVALGALLGEPLTAVAAVGGALLFNLVVVKSMIRMVTGFASQPARNLEGCLMQHVEAVTPFDERGEGLVRVLIDGQSTDVLARLSDKERQEGLRVRRGDHLLIEEVDPKTNSCRVCRG